MEIESDDILLVPENLIEPDCLIKGLLEVLEKYL